MYMHCTCALNMYMNVCVNVHHTCVKILYNNNNNCYHSNLLPLRAGQIPEASKSCHYRHLRGRYQLESGHHDEIPTYMGQLQDG